MTAHVPPVPIVVMGVSGSGKTTVGSGLARRLGVPFVDADDLHPPQNRDKMAGGTPLTDDDRWPWLRSVGRRIAAEHARSRGVVVACSALRHEYRDAIRAAARAPVAFAHLDGAPDLLLDRMTARRNHFMPPALLRSQLEILEPLRDEEPGITIPIEDDPEDLVSRIHDWIIGHEGELSA